MKYYRDLREFIGVLEGNEKLVTIEREINKYTELQPLVRWQFRGLPENNTAAGHNQRLLSRTQHFK